MSNTTVKPVVGAPAIVQSRVMFHKGYVVTKVTPGGRVTVTRTSDGHQRIFDSKGREMGKQFYADTLRLDVEQVEARIAWEAKLNAAANALNEVRLDGERVRSTWGPDSMRECLQALEAKLAEARIAVAALGGE